MEESKTEINTTESDQMLLYKIRLADRAERHQDVIRFIKIIVDKQDGHLTIEERQILSFAYKSLVNAKRASWRTIHTKEMTEKDKAKLKLIKEYINVIVKGLKEDCLEILSLLKGVLIPKSQNVEYKVFYLTMKGDYYRYLSEINSKREKENCVTNATRAYKEALDNCKKLEATHPTKLGLVLNYSVFFHETINLTAQAIRLAQQSYKEANEELGGDITDLNSYKTTIKIMESLRKNVCSWAGVDDEADKNNVTEEK